ncbi:hypothetical protein T440DRAFT_502092 [Plenodomus tracheiphilus IPT5]|uniref:Zn(2)-C6 fungal-type domain-containing protein n=1 Tax=Plenodomus tracheiphilus IPT5 TaxID=1408161 RepID=A0A6A7ARH7_9PLEO|nr:hypothetical protein T440DRAFT_502092 [Plenodomus tracheiphilus IPT5]
MDEPSTNGSVISNSSQKRPAQEAEDNRRKRAKYTATACNECKRTKVKCIRKEDDADCQRCTTMKTACVVVPTAIQSAKDKDKEKHKTKVDDSHFRQLSHDITCLREQVSALTAVVASLVEKQARPIPSMDGRTPLGQSASPAQTVTTIRTREPVQPKFIGPTRSAFSFNVAETSLTRVGIAPSVALSTNSSSVASSREPSPEPPNEVRSLSVSSDTDLMTSISVDEAIRLLGIYEDEIACVHPIIETKVLVSKVPQILDFIKNPHRPITDFQDFDPKDAHVLRLAIATALICETFGKNEISDRLVASVKADVGKITNDLELVLKDIQIMSMLSLYFCHTSEELFAWRAIGCAARQSLELGLHRKQSLMENFKDERSRNLAVQVFWVVYELDRRWSFGTSLSFALYDRDIDPQLPEPGKEFPYLKCMVSYARICSRVWDALPSYGSQMMPKETEDYLDFTTQNWLLSIPEELHFVHPRLGLASRSQPRQLRRLRTLLYLRGNYMRTLIHRHHVLTSDNIRANTQSAQLVVDVAKDTIQVLVHLSNTSDIYVREQSIYHYYLLSALAVVLLAVCHSPNLFAESCRDSFISAVELVKGFARHSDASRRLWKSIRGLLPVVKSLSRRVEAGRQYHQAAYRGPDFAIGQPPLMPNQGILAEPLAAGMTPTWGNNAHNFGADMGMVPDVFDIGNDLLDIYNVFGAAAATDQQQPMQTPPENYGELGMSMWEIEGCLLACLHDGNGMNVLHLPVHDPDLMAIRPRAQTIELTQHIYASHFLVDHITAHTIIFRTPTMRQRLATRTGIGTSLNTLAFCTPRNGVCSFRIRPHVEIRVTDLLEELATWALRRRDRGPVLLLNVAKRFLCVEEEITSSRGDCVDHADRTRIVICVANLCAHNVGLIASRADPHRVAGACYGVGGRTLLDSLRLDGLPEVCAEM